ncbi:MAG: hypothetical protein IPP32_03325 [Bacteroidetes bacterium]|nr:hypothetical protein [Bacteroidota bacterium]
MHQKKRVSTPRFFLLLTPALFIVLLVGCSQMEPVNKDLRYFDLQRFYDSEAQKLSASKAQLKKTTLFDGQRNSTILTQPDWHKEFALLMLADINKPAWKNSFRIDTVKHDSTLLIRYTATENHIAVRLLEVTRVMGEVVKIHCKSVADNFVYATTQEMWYAPQEGFRVFGSQKVLWFYEKRYEIKTAFMY